MKTSLKMALCYLIISTSAVIIFSLSSCSKNNVSPDPISDTLKDSAMAMEKTSKTYNMKPSAGYVGPPVYDSLNHAFPDIPKKCPTPGNIKIGRVTFSSALITWSAVPDVDGYAIEYEKVIPSAAIITVQTSDSVLVIRGLKPETLYQCRLQAMRSDGFSNYSPWQAFKTKKLQGVPVETIENNSR